MEIWQWVAMALVSCVSAGVGVFGVILVVMGRDRSLIQFIGQGKAETMAAIELAKDDLRAFAKQGDDEIHSRLNRFQEAYVRRDDFNAHEARIGKTVDEIKADIARALSEMKSDQRRMHEQNAGDLRDIKQMITSSTRIREA